MRIACLLLALVSSGALAAPPRVAVEPKQVLLGETERVQVRVTGVREDAVVRGATSFGALQEVEVSGTERLFEWTPPDSRAPAMALLVLWVDEGAKPPDVAVVRLPMIGQTELEVATEPGAEVRVVVGKKTFGPIRADDAGRAAVPIEVPPGIFDARVLGTRKGQATEVTVPLGVPPYNPLMAILGPEPMYTEGIGWLWVFDASDFYTDKLSVALRGGDARLLETTKRGTLFEITPARRARRIHAVATAKENAKAKAEVRAPLIFGPPPQRASAPAPEPAGAAPPASPLPRESELRLPAPALVPGVLAGGFYSGGANLGLFFAVNASLKLFGPLRAEAELGLRRSALATVLPGTGELSSSVMSLPVTVGARARLVEAGPWAVDLRAGGGLLPFLHVLASDFQPTATETGLGWELFGAAEVAHDFGPLELFLDLRAAWTPVQTQRVRAQHGGLVIGLGARRSSP